MLKIRPAKEADFTNISVLVVNAFGQPNESNLIKALRVSGAAAIELVAEDKEGLVGHVLLSWFDSPDNWLTLAPLSVRLASQNKGVGRELVRYSLDQARQNRVDAVVVVGDPQYYRPLGFTFDGLADLSTPYPRKYTGLHAISAKTANAKTVLAYPKPFNEV